MTTKLDEAAVLKIRERRAAGETIESIANDFGVSNTWIGKISRGEWWKKVGGARIHGHARTFVVDANAEAIYQRWASGETVGEIAASLGVGRETVRMTVLAKGGKRRRNEEIEARYWDGETLREISADFGMTDSAVSYIVSDRSKWRESV